MYNLTLGHGHFSQKNHVFFMPHTFSQNEHPFSQCKHFNQVEPFQKSWFLLVFGFGKKDLFYEFFVVKKKETKGIKRLENLKQY